MKVIILTKDLTIDKYHLFDLVNLVLDWNDYDISFYNRGEIDTETYETGVSITSNPIWDKDLKRYDVVPTEPIHKLFKHLSIHYQQPPEESTGLPY